MSESATDHQARRFVRRRYVARRDEPKWPFAPYGLLPVLGLLFLLWFALFPFARDHIEQSAERAASTALVEVGETWARPRVSGQWVTLEGTPPSNSAALRAMTAVRQEKARAVFGRSVPVTRVRSNFATGDNAEPLNPDWIFRVSEGVLHLDGQVPNETSRQAIVDAAESSLDPPRLVNVDNDLTLTNRPADEGYVTVALRGIRTVSQCDAGVSTFKEQVFSLSCELPEARAERVQALASAPLPIGQAGVINVLANEAIRICEETIADLLDKSKIQFAVGSARIDPASSALLDSIADEAGDCPGRLRIEGHTDNTGSNAKNLELSQQRANAVRQALVDRGLSIDRMITEGRGAEDPVSPNATAQGRANNRRIEIRVVRSPEQ